VQILSYHDIFVLRMEIQYLGHFSVLLKGKKEQILSDPNGKLEKYSGRVVLSTNGMWTMSKLKDGQVVIAGPGEFEVGGVEINGISAGNNQTVFLVTYEGLTVCFLGEIKEELSDKRVERVDSADILVVPVNKVHEPMFKTFLKWAKIWGANYLIPIGYETQIELDKFLDVVDAEGLGSVDQLKVTRDELPEGLEVVVLKNNE
jgi:L-ascorbate metabolism protein UlaG (beta-lactamase superfamily)